MRFLVTFLVLFLTVFAYADNSAIFYVSPNGSDSSTGS